MQAQTKTGAIYAEVFSPTYKKQLSFTGYVRSFSAVNDVGPYDILPGHENLVTTAVGMATIIDQNGKRFDLSLGRAVVEVSENVLKVFVDY